jgi:RNAse (barnase) inhibitor barstar
MMGENSEVVIINLSQITQETELVEFMIKQLGFPDIYGSNLHSLGEHFFYDSMLKVPSKIRLVGFNEFSSKDPTLASKLLSLLKSNQKLDLEIVNA